MATQRETFLSQQPMTGTGTGAGRPITLSGYALVWNLLSEDRGGYRVRLKPGSAKFATPTLALYHHDFAFVIGSSANNTLRFSSDSVGVKVEIDLPDTTVGYDVGELVGKGYVRGMSFAMASKPAGQMVVENGLQVFEATGFLVDEVTVTPIPAFHRAQVGLKGRGEVPGSFAARIAQANELERYKFWYLASTLEV